MRFFIKIVGWLFVFVLFLSAFNLLTEKNNVTAATVNSCIGFIIIFFLIKDKFKLKPKTKKQDIPTTNELLEISNGNLPVIQTDLKLKVDEVAHYSKPVSLVEYKTTGYTGTGVGVRFRVAKGITIGTGKSRSKAKKEFVETAMGYLTLTNHRVIFAGNNKSFSYGLSKVINFNCYGDSITINTNNKSHVLKTSPELVNLFKAIVNQI